MTMCITKSDVLVNNKITDFFLNLNKIYYLEFLNFSYQASLVLCLHFEVISLNHAFLYDLN